MSFIFDQVSLLNLITGCIRFFITFLSLVSISKAQIKGSSLANLDYGPYSFTCFQAISLFKSSGLPWWAIVSHSGLTGKAVADVKVGLSGGLRRSSFFEARFQSDIFGGLITPSRSLSSEVKSALISPCPETTPKFESSFSIIPG